MLSSGHIINCGTSDNSLPSSHPSHPNASQKKSFQECWQLPGQGSPSCCKMTHQTTEIQGAFQWRCTSGWVQELVRILPTLIIHFYPLCVAESILDSETQLRGSLRAGRGSSGSIQQLKYIENIQLARPSWQSICDLDVATEGEVINVMAPSHFPDMLHHNEESLVPLWLESFTSSTQVLPTFMVLEFSQFSFKLPPQPTTSLGGDDDSEPVRRSNTWKYTVPVRHAWVYDPTLSYWQVTMYTAWQVLGCIVPFFLSSLSQFFHIFCGCITCWLRVHDTSAN